MIKWILREETTSTASEDFKRNRLSGKRYVDKTGLLALLLSEEHKTTLHQNLPGSGTVSGHGKGRYGTN